jgi:hypothetical protein
MTRPTTRHIVASGLFRCLHCGSSYTGPDTDTPIDALISVIRGFALMHKHCQPRPEPSKQVELFDELAALQAVVPLQPPTDCFHGIDGNSDDPDPETDPPGHPDQDRAYLDDETDVDGNPLPAPAYPQFMIDQELERKFRELFPIALVPWTLRADLAIVLQRIEGAVLPSAATIDGWLTTSLPFQKAAGWVRDELADMNREEHPEFDVFLPLERQPMPEELAALVFPAKKPKRGARPLTSRKRKGATTEAP